jgi:site-specific recombinase XerD
MKEQIEDFIRQGRAEGWSADTLKSYRNKLLDLARFLAKAHIEKPTDVKPEHLDAHLRSLSRRGVKAGSLAASATAMRAFFRSLAAKGRLLSDPARDLLVPDPDDQPLPVPPLEEDEVADLLDNMPRRNVLDLRNRALLELLYGCGLRASEAVTLDVADLDLRGKTLHVREGKGGKERMLPVGRGATLATKDWLAVRRSLLKGPDHGALFLASNGKRLGDEGVSKVFAHVNKRRVGKRRVHPHLLRHSIAVHLLRGGADVRHVQEFLGHASLDTTKIYLRLVPGRLKEDYEKSFPEIAIRT